MEKKAFIVGLSTFVGGLTSGLLGGFDKMLQALILFMLVDYFTGLSVAFIFKTSPKTESGGASSKIGFKGLTKKVVMILLIMVVVQADAVLGTNNFFRQAAIWGFLANEMLSIIENAGLMGLKLPQSFTKAVDVLSKKEGEE